MNKNTKYVIRIIAHFLLVIGCIGFFAGFIAMGFGVAFENLGTFELPLGDLEGIAVDSGGNIYCGLQFYSRIQVYDSEGNFIYGKFINSAGVSFRIKINQDDQLEVATARNDKLYIFEKDGTLVRELSDVGYYFDNFGETGESKFHDKKHNVTYYIRPALLGPFIVKRYASGEKKVIIRTPFYKWIFKGPLPAWFFMMIGALLSMFVNKNPFKHLLKRKQTDHQD